MASDPAAAVASALGQGVRRCEGLSGGCVGEVYRLVLDDGAAVVAKVDGRAEPSLDIEAYMLRYLAGHSRLPVPAVLHAAPALLVMEHVDGASRFGPAEQTHAAELLADLHAVSAETFGLERDTLIGGLRQPNAPESSWIAFFREHRILYMAREAHREGRFDADILRRIEAFADHLDEWLLDPPHPSLLHGDVWTTNVLARNGRIAAFIDPAVYHGHPEIELAFTTLFGTFGEPFFRRYHEIRPIPGGFFDTRRDIYNLYPLLVHVRLFGAGYLDGVLQVLKRHGY